MSKDDHEKLVPRSCQLGAASSLDNASPLLLLGTLKPGAAGRGQSWTTWHRSSEALGSGHVDGYPQTEHSEREAAAGWGTVRMV